MADDDDVDIVEGTGEMDAHAAEALRLLIRRLARVHGVELTEVRIEPDDVGSA